MGLLTGKTALITGAARGIGKAIALKYASEGANIAFTDLVLNDDMKAGLEATRQEIEALGVKCLAYAGNAADFAETEAVVKQIHADFGSIDILVNNAGITKDGLMLRMSEAQWDEPEERIQLHPRMCSDNAPSAWWFHHQHVERCRCSRQCRTVQLLSFQGWYDRSCKVYCPGAWSKGCSRQCRCSRFHRDCHDSPAA